MTSFQNLAQSEREAILNRIRDVSDDSIDLIKDNLPASSTVIWSSQKTLQETASSQSIIYAIALG